MKNVETTLSKTEIAILLAENHVEGGIALELAKKFAGIKSARFLRFPYTNSDGQKAYHLVNINITKSEAYRKDHETLSRVREGFDPNTVPSDIFNTKKCVSMTRDEINAAILVGFDKRIQECDPNAFVERQKNGESKGAEYVSVVGKSLKYLPSKHEFYIDAMAVSKTIVKPSEKVRKPVNSRPDVIFKGWLDKEYNLRTSKFRKFKISDVAGISINGERIEFIPSEDWLNS